MDTFFIKVCGVTRLADALHASDCGATALGFVFWPASPRAVTPGRAGDIIAALPKAVTPVGVFVNESVEGIRAAVEASGIKVVQLHGDETPHYAADLEWPLLRAVGVDEVSTAGDMWPADVTLLLDARDPVRRGGTGTQVDWTLAAAIARRRRVVLAGGLTPDNVANAVHAVNPYGVDVSSGVEASPGVKDAEKIARFVANARAAFEAELSLAQRNGGSDA